MKNISFLFGIHNHQPIGNFEEVFEEAYQKSYAPFLNLLHAHPQIKWNLHCTGILWQWLEKHHPDYLEKVRLMVAKNQLELLSGGFYEPILSVLPDADKVGQILKLNQYLNDRFAVKPEGMWCAERVWEPHLPQPMRRAQIQYTVLDDTHFLTAGLSAGQLTGYYRVEEQNDGVDIFPISQELRYTIPFQKPEESIQLLKQVALADHGSRLPALVMADDGEKFGLWPETFDLVYKQGWLEKFLTLLENNSDWIRTETFSEHRRTNRPLGKIYLPTASYFEMSQWSLPTDSGLEFEETLEQVSKEEYGAKLKRFLKGGIWRNFFAKYPESNSMYKKMLRVSEKVHQAKKSLELRVKSLENSRSRNKKNSPLATRNSQLISEALDHLWAAQCNCAYWHGVFGGLYLPILRQAIYKHLIEAEKVLDSIHSKQARVECCDLDGDGNEEIILETALQNIFLSPHCGGALFEWDFKPSSVNIVNVLSRRPEIYHKKIKNFFSQETQDKGAEKSMLQLLQAKEKGSGNLLAYDWYRRACLIDHFLHPNTSPESFIRCQYGEQGDFVLGAYESLEGESIKLARNGAVWVQDKNINLRLEKSVKVLAASSKNLNAGRTGLEVSYKISNPSNEPIKELWFAPEFNFSFSVFDPQRDISLTGCKEWERADPYLFWKMRVVFSDFADIWILPLETISNSESGFEKTFQGMVFLPHWKFSLGGKESFERTLTLTVEKN